ncbi:MAG: hypothetical protein ABIK32_07490 [Chloroflexota bacterium]
MGKLIKILNLVFFRDELPQLLLDFIVFCQVSLLRDMPPIIPVP